MYSVPPSVKIALQAHHTKSCVYFDSITVLHLAHRAILRINFELFMVFILSHFRAHYISGHPRDLPNRIGMRHACTTLVLDDVDLRRVVTSRVALFSQLIDVQVDAIPKRSFENTLIHSRAPLVHVGSGLK